MGCGVLLGLVVGTYWWLHGDFRIKTDWGFMLSLIVPAVFIVDFAVAARTRRIF